MIQNCLFSLDEMDEIRHFAYKNTCNEAIFDLWPKRKNLLKLGIPDMIPEKKFDWL